MIRFIAAIDNKKGIANNSGIPWQGMIPGDLAHFRSKTLNGNVLMGYGWYKEQIKPLPNRKNIVATSSVEKLRSGFDKILDAREFLKKSNDDIWVGGGAALFSSTIDLADELYLTHLLADFNCTKYFPNFETSFELSESSSHITENGIEYYFAMYVKKII